MAARFGQDVGVAVLSNRPLALWLLGYPDDAAKEADDAVVMAHTVGQVGTLLYMLARVAWIKLIVGDFPGADKLIQELAANAADLEASYWTAAASLLRGCREALVGDPGVGVELIGRGLAPSRTRGAKLLRLPWYFWCLAKAYTRLNQLGAARQCLEEAFAAVATTEEAWPEAELHRLAGELALTTHDPDRFAAARHFERALAVARRQQAKLYELRAAVSLARLRRDAGDPQRAINLLQPVFRWFTQGLTTPDLELAAKLIAELAGQDIRPHENRRPDAHAVRVG
jgi:predicted ATPase